MRRYFIFETATKKFVFLTRTYMVYSYVTIDPYPILYFVFLSSEKVKHSFDSIRFCKYPVVFFVLL